MAMPRPVLRENTHHFICQGLACLVSKYGQTYSAHTHTHIYIYIYIYIFGHVRQNCKTCALQTFPSLSQLWPEIKSLGKVLRTKLKLKQVAFSV